MSDMSRPRIIIVEDNLVFRQSLILLFTIEKIANVIGEASNGNEFLDVLAQNKPDLVLMGISMTEVHGIVATKKALELLPDLKIIVFSMFGNEEYYTNLPELGFKGRLLKSCHIDEYEKAFHKVIKGENHFSTN